MADKVSMSLDDIIKKQKKERQQKQAKGKGKGVKGFPTRPIRGSPQFQGRVSRNFTFKGVDGQRQGKVAKQFVKQARGNVRYFNKSLPLNQTRARGGKQPFNRSNIRGSMSPRKSRKQLYMNQRPNQQFRRNYDIYEAPGPSRQLPQFIPGRNQRGRRTWAYNGDYQNLISPGRFVNRQRNFQLARKRVQRARNVIASRIARNVGNLGQRRRAGRVRGTGRIVVGRFGFMTTGKANLGQYRANIQQKIIRAQMARQGVSNSPMFRGQGRPENLGAISQDVRSSYPSRRGRSGRGGRDIRQGSQNWSQTYVRGSPPQPRPGGYRREFQNDEEREEEWNIPMRRIQNTPPRRPSNNVDFDRGEVGLPSGLDPKIQSHISYIQEQGRRLRGEDKYDISPPATPTVSVSYSSMSLSDRFKRFMN